jgi:hypothetical protein
MDTMVELMAWYFHHPAGKCPLGDHHHQQPQCWPQFHLLEMGAAVVVLQLE